MSANMITPPAIAPPITHFRVRGVRQISHVIQISAVLPIIRWATYSAGASLPAWPLAQSTIDHRNEAAHNATSTPYHLKNGLRRVSGDPMARLQNVRTARIAIRMSSGRTPIEPPNSASSTRAIGTKLAITAAESASHLRSEERPVGKECRYRWSPHH